jgi:MFS family permease
LLLFFIGVFSAVISSTYFLLPLYLEGGLHFSGGQIGLLYAILNLNTILVAFPVGVFGDRYPARVLTRLGLAGTAVCLWGMASASHFWPFLAVFWGFGLSLSLFRQSLDILLFKENPADAARRFGEYNAWRMGGMMMGTLAGGLMVYLWKFPLTLQLFGVWLFIMLWPAGRLPLTGGARAPVWQYRRDFFTKPVLFFAAWLFLFTLHWGAEATSLALFLRHNLGLQPMGVGTYMAGEFGVISVTVYLYGRFWAGKLSPLSFLTVALLASGSGHILMTWPVLPWSFAMRALHGFGDGLILMETYTTMARLFHVDRIGGNSSLISLTCTSGVFVGSLIFGPLGATFGYQIPLIISGVISLALLPMAYAGLKEK